MALASRPSAQRAQGGSLSLPVVLTMAVVAIGLAGALSLLPSSQATRTTYDMRELEMARDDWQARIHELEAEIASLGSLERIDREARERLGMVPPTETIHITVDVPAPEKQILPERFLPTREEKTEEDRQSLWESLLDFLPLP